MTMSALSAAGESPMAGFLRFVRNVTVNWVGMLVIALIWEAAGQAFNQPWLPPLSRVLMRMVELFTTGGLSQHLLASLTSLAIGFLIALVIGLVVGILMGLFNSIYAALDVYVNAMLFTPGLIFAPILFAIFGLSDATRISVVVIYAVFIIIINTAAAVRNVDRPLIEMAASYGANRTITVFRIVLPDAFPLIIAGLRMGVGRAVKGMVNGEMFIALIGIGGQAARYGKQFDFTSVWAISVFIMALAVVINQLVTWLEKRMTAWVD
jgi:ABC-type nitrate/sulfonate/bicarbonate transport system permease component